MSDELENRLAMLEKSIDNIGMAFKDYVTIPVMSDSIRKMQKDFTSDIAMLSHRIDILEGEKTSAGDLDTIVGSVLGKLPNKKKEKENEKRKYIKTL